MAVLMKFCFVLVAGMLFGSLTAKPMEDPAPSRYYYDGESNAYFDVGKLFPILYRKRFLLYLKKNVLKCKYLR